MGFYRKQRFKTQPQQLVRPRTAWPIIDYFIAGQSQYVYETGRPILVPERDGLAVDIPSVSEKVSYPIRGQCGPEYTLIAHTHCSHGTTDQRHILTHDYGAGEGIERILQFRYEYEIGGDHAIRLIVFNTAGSNFQAYVRSGGASGPSDVLFYLDDDFNHGHIVFARVGRGSINCGAYRMDGSGAVISGDVSYTGVPQKLRDSFYTFNWPGGHNGVYSWVALQGKLSQAQCKEIASNYYYELFERDVWIPTGPSDSFELNINDLSHAHPVKEIDLGGNYTLGVASLDHAHPVDQANLAEVGTNFPLDIDGLIHLHPVDQVGLSPDLLLDIDKLTHQHPTDEPEFTIPPNDLTIDDLSHAHPTEESDLGGIYDLNIQGLSHDHPVDQSALGGLEGDDTALKMTPTEWLASAGVQLSNTSGVDIANWHVVEVVFNGVTSVLTIDGVKVEGDAGIRALEAVILGAGLGGLERANIQLGELQLYSGEVAEVDRVAIRNGLTTKWITG